MISGLNYIQANEAINAENGAPGELDVANRPLKELISLFNSGDADTQVRRINFKIPAAQMITNGVTSDNVVSFDYSTNKYIKTNWNDKKALGIIDVENLIIYSFGEYTLKNINNLVPGKAYFLSQQNDGEFVAQDSQYASATHIGIAISSNTIEINKYIDATFASVQIDDITPSFSNTYSSNKIEELLNTRASKIYVFSDEFKTTSLSPAPTSVLNIPLNSIILNLNDNVIYFKVSNTGLNTNSSLSAAISLGVIKSIRINWANIRFKPTFATVATSGSYGDLSNKPVNATTTVDGFMSKEDKLKLTNINPQTASVANSVVLRDSNGNFSAGIISASLNGNSSTTTKLKTAITINNESFDGSENIIVDPVTDIETSSANNHYLGFFALNQSTNQNIKVSTNLKYVPSTNTLTTNISGKLNSFNTSYSGTPYTIAVRDNSGNLTVGDGNDIPSVILKNIGVPTFSKYSLLNNKLYGTDTAGSGYFIRTNNFSLTGTTLSITTP